MSGIEIGMCGLVCTGCDWVVSHGCKGCKATKGNPFHGACRLARCVIDRKLEDCSFCPDLPCELLESFSNDDEHGDDGARIRALYMVQDGRKPHA